LRSIRRDLLLWAIGTLVLGVTAIAVATYYSARRQIDAMLDGELLQIAQAVHLREDWADAGNVRIAREGVTFAVRAYDDGGKVFFESGLPSLPPDVPKTLDPGFSDVPTPDGSWRVYTHVMPEGVVQVAQPEVVREALARSLALRMSLPELLFVPLLAAVLAWVLRRSLRPLYDTSARVRERDAARLDALPTQDVPEELLPLVEQINALLARLAASLETERRFVADAAHELRSPVAALALQAQVAERAAAPEVRNAAFFDLKQGIARAGRLVEQLLDFARLEPGVRGPLAQVDLAHVAREVVGAYAARADAVEVDLGADAPHKAPLLAVESEMRSLVTNLVDNAIRYAPRRSEVTVSVRQVDSAVELVVADAGPGIPRDERERVFDRFYRSPGASGVGSGLGLAIVKAVADAHGATIALDDGPQGKGLCVTVQFPRAA